MKTNRRSYAIKRLTLTGSMKKIVAKSPATTDVNHFCVSSSPNWIPRAIIRRTDIAPNSNENPYARKRNHHGNVNVLFRELALGELKYKIKEIIITIKFI
jgi:hypothetical protein